jgi:hypothetical protein
VTLHPAFSIMTAQHPCVSNLLYNTGHSIYSSVKTIQP